MLMFLLGGYCIGSWIIGSQVGWLNKPIGLYGAIMLIFSPITLPLNLILLFIVG